MKGAFGLPGILKSACFHSSWSSRQLLFTKRRSPETSVWRNAGGTLFDAHYAAVFTDAHSGKELAWLLSAVFWCALGALCFLFMRSLLQQRKHHK